MNLDEPMRERLREIATRDDEGELSADARERIALAVSETGAETIMRARRARMATGAAVSVAFAAAAALVITFVATSGEESAMVEPDSEGPQESVDPGAVVEPESPVGIVVDDEPDAPCATRTVVEDAATIEPADDGGWRLDRGSVALLVGHTGGEAELVRATRCETEVRLSAGTVFVHARDLGGGSLHIVTPTAEVRVRGTVFSVALTPEGSLVVVDEGRVEVLRDGAVLGAVTPGESARVTAAGLSLQTASDESRARLREVLGLGLELASSAGEPHQAETPSPARGPASANSAPSAASPEALVAEALAAQRRGDLAEARRLLRRAGGGQGYASQSAWITLARLELSAGDARAAEQAVQQYRRRYRRGALTAEADWIAVRAARARGDRERAMRLARALVARHGDTPQANAARRLLADVER